MKKHWKLLALMLAVLLLCTACEQRKTVDISDGGDMIGTGAPAPAAQKPQSAPTAEPAKPQAEKPTEEPAPAAPAPAETEEKPAAAAPSGSVALVEMSMRSGGKGMCLVPVNVGAVFVLNSVLTDTCTITTDPNNFIAADCTVKAKAGMDARIEFVLLQNDQEVLTADLNASLNEGENTIQVLIKLAGAASGEYVGKLYINGEFIGGESVKA